MSITSTAANNVIKWIDFSIGAGEKVAFDSHNYLNYVTGHARSDILGTLTGGGSIYIVNLNGILIGDGAQVDVGSLYLSTRNLTTEQLAGFNTAAGKSISTRPEARLPAIISYAGQGTRAFHLFRCRHGEVGEVKERQCYVERMGHWPDLCEA